MSPSAHTGTVMVQTVILVLAAVGGTATMAGTVGADAQNLTVTNEGQKLQPSGNLTFEVTDGVSVDDHPIHVWIDSKTANGKFDPGERNLTIHSSNGETENGTFSDVDLAPGKYAIMAVENESLNGGERNQTRVNFTIDDAPPGFDAAVAFTETNGTQAYGAVGETVVEVNFNESLSDGTDGTRPRPGDVLVKLTNGTVLNPTFNDGGTGDTRGDRRVVLDLGSDIGPADVKAVGVNESATFTDEAGNRVVPHIEAAQRATTTVAEEGTNRTAFKGEAVAIVGDQDDEEIFMRSTDDKDIIDNTTGRASKVFVWPSGTWSTDPNYRVFFDGRTNPNFLLREDVKLALEDLGLTVIPDRPVYSTDEALTATVSANVANRTVTVRLVSNGSVKVTRIVTMDGARTTVDFGQQAEGDYTVEVEDDTTGLTDVTGTIQVRTSNTPTPTATATVTPTPSPTPARTPTLTPAVSPTGTGMATPAATGPNTPFPAVTPHVNSTPSPTPSPSATSGRTTEGTGETAASGEQNGGGDILGMMWKGVTSAVDAMAEAVSEALSGLLG